MRPLPLTRPALVRDAGLALVVLAGFALVDAALSFARAPQAQWVWMELLFAPTIMLAALWPLFCLRALVHAGSRFRAQAAAFDGVLIVGPYALFEPSRLGPPSLDLPLCLAAMLGITALAYAGSKSLARGRVLQTMTLLGGWGGLQLLSWQSKSWFRLSLLLLVAVCALDLVRGRTASSPASDSATTSRSRRSAATGFAIWMAALVSSSLMWSTSMPLRWMVVTYSSQQALLARPLGPGFAPESSGAGQAAFARSLDAMYARERSGAQCVGEADDAAGLVPDARYDYIFIGVDALRSDHAQYLVETRAALGPLTQFTRAVSPAPRTVFSLGAMARGRAVSAVPFEGGVAETAPPTLGHALREVGYQASFIPSHRYLDRSMRIFDGFETVEPEAFERVNTRVGNDRQVIPARDVLARARTLLDEAQGPTLLWTHLMEAHAPYRYEGGQGPADRRGYRHALRELDHQLAAFIEEVEASHSRPVVWLVFGDHGEAFGARGMHKHSTSLFADQVRVGAWMRVPGQQEQRVDAPVVTTALTSSVAEQVLGKRPCSMQVPSVWACLEDANACPRVALSELIPFGSIASDLRAYTFANERVIYNVGAQAYSWEQESVFAAHAPEPRTASR